MDTDLKRRRFHLLAASAVVIATLLVLYFLGIVLLTLGLSVVIAYVLLPVARVVERAFPWRRGRPGLARGVATGIIFLCLIAILAGILALVIPPTVEQSRQFAEDFPGFLESARLTIEGWIARYNRPDSRRGPGPNRGDAGRRRGNRRRCRLPGGLADFRGYFRLFRPRAGLATAPVLVFYLMKDSGMIRASLYAPFPESVRPYLKDALDIAENTIGGYIRGQITLGVIVGVVVTIALLLLGIPFSYILGIIAGLTELVPIIGPWIGGAVGVLVTLATAPDKVPWVILIYLGVQLLENTLLVPRIQGDTLKLHPVAVILIIVVASNYFGLWGVILGPPLVSMVRDLAVYFRNEWNGPETISEAECAPRQGEPESEDTETGQVDRDSDH